MDDRITVLFAELSGDDMAFAQFALDHLGSQSPDTVNLHLRCIVRYNDGCLHSKKFCRKRHSFTVVSRRCGYHSVFKLLLRQRQHLIQGAPDFKWVRALHALRLDIYLTSQCFIQILQMNHRRLVNIGSKTLPCRLDFFDSKHGNWLLSLLFDWYSYCLIDIVSAWLISYLLN